MFNLRAHFRAPWRLFSIVRDETRERRQIENVEWMNKKLNGNIFRFKSDECDSIYQPEFSQSDVHKPKQLWFEFSRKDSKKFDNFVEKFEMFDLELFSF